MAFKRSRVRSSPSPPKIRLREQADFLSIAKAMVYHHRKVYIITRQRAYHQPSGCIIAFSMMICRFFKTDNIQNCVLMICKAFALIMLPCTLGNYFFTCFVACGTPLWYNFTKGGDFMYRIKFATIPEQI